MAEHDDGTVDVSIILSFDRGLPSEIAGTMLFNDVDEDARCFRQAFFAPPGPLDGDGQVQINLFRSHPTHVGLRSSHFFLRSRQMRQPEVVLAVRALERCEVIV